MAESPFYDRILETTTTTGTGTLTLAGAVTGYRSFSVVGNGNTTPMAIWEVDSNGNPSGAWEVAHVCTYTAAGTTLSRGTFLASSTGSVISFGAGTKRVGQVLPAAILQGFVYASRTYIAGLLVTKNSGGNTLDISAGSCYDPSSQKIITYAGATAVSAGTLGASQWNQVYIYDNAGTVTIEVVNNADPPSTAYAGTARQGGTNSNRRWIGSFLTTSASNIYTMNVKELAMNGIEAKWLTTTNASPFRVLSGGTSTTYVSVSVAGVVPRYAGISVFLEVIGGLATTGGAEMAVVTSIDGTNDDATIQAHIHTAGHLFQIPAWVGLDSSVPQLYYKTSATSPAVGPLAYLDVRGWRIAR